MTKKRTQVVSHLKIVWNGKDNSAGDIDYQIEKDKNKKTTSGNVPVMDLGSPMPAKVGNVIYVLSMNIKVKGLRIE